MESISTSFHLSESLHPLTSRTVTQHLFSVIHQFIFGITHLVYHLFCFEPLHAIMLLLLPRKQANVLQPSALGVISSSPAMQKSLGRHFLGFENHNAFPLLRDVDRWRSSIGLGTVPIFGSARWFVFGRCHLIADEPRQRSFASRLWYFR